MPTVNAMSTAGVCLTCAKLLEVSKIGRSNDHKRVDFKVMHVPLQNALLKKLDVTTNERRFAQEIKMVDRFESQSCRYSSTSHDVRYALACRVVPNRPLLISVTVGFVTTS